MLDFRLAIRVMGMGSPEFRDNSKEMEVFVARVDECMEMSLLTIGALSRLNRSFHSVLVDGSVSGEDVDDFRIFLVLMIADGSALLDGHAGKKPAVGFYKGLKME